MTGDDRLERRRAALPTPRYPDLPVVAHRAALLDAIRDNQVVVVAGETGDVDGRVRTLLEELRVSLFAQSVGAKGGVSEAKVRAALNGLS